MNSNLDLKMAQFLSSFKLRERPKKCILIFACSSLVLHSGFFIFLVLNDIVRPRQREIESIPVEMISGVSLTATELNDKLNKIPGYESENSEERSKNEKEQHRFPRETQASKDNQVRKQDLVKLQGQHEPSTTPENSPALSSLGPQRNSITSEEDKEHFNVKPKSRTTYEEPHHAREEMAASGKSARKASKTSSKSENTNIPARSAAGDKIAYRANAQGKVGSSAFIETGKQRATTQDQNNAQVSLPNIPFDPQVFRAVAVPLPSPDGSELVSYKEIVFGLLERAKHYPESALARGAKGIALVEFSLDSRGSVVERLLLKSSGEADLDSESLELLDRASPFPPPPPGAQQSFSAEIGFGIAPEEQ